MDWIRAQAHDLGRQPLLVTFSFQNGDHMEAFRGLEHVTTRSRGSVTGPVGRPVLAYVPDERTLELAHRYARGSALCVVESVSFPVHGWARQTGAVSLLDGRVLPALDASVATTLDGLKFAGNNGWGDKPGKRDAARLLGDLRGRVDLDEVVGYILARGASERGAKNLRAIAEKSQLPHRRATRVPVGRRRR
ncbi:MAG: hypothetical protein ACT4QF_09370 [Sporichthyaceae bacterium]